MKKIDNRIEALDKMILLLKERKAKDKAGFQIFVKNIDGKTYTINQVRGELSVEELKVKIEDKVGLPVEEQRLIHQGKQLEDDKLLRDYKIEKESNIHLLLRLRGGGYGEILVELARSLGVEATFGSVAGALGISTATLWSGLIMGGIGLTWSISKIINYLRGDNVAESESDEEEENVGFQIFVKNYDGKTYTINDLEEETTLAELKIKIESKIGLAIKQQSLSYQKGKLIEDGRSMFDYGIEGGVTLFLSVQLPAPNTLEEMKETANQLLGNIQEVQASFNFLTEDLSASFQKVFDDLLVWEETEGSFDLYEELLVIYENTQEEFHQIIDEKTKECEDLAKNVKDGLLEIEELNKSEFLVAGAQGEIAVFEEEYLSIEAEDLSLLKIEAYRTLIEKVKERKQGIVKLINEKKKEWEALFVVSEEKVTLLKALEADPFLEEEPCKICEAMLAVPSLESIFDRISEYTKLIQDSEAKIRFLNQTIEENKTNYNTIKGKVGAKVDNLLELKTQEFLQGENFEELDAFISAGEKSLELDPSLDAFKELKELDVRKDYGLMLERLSNRIATNKIAWNQVHEEAQELLINVEALGTSKILQNETIISLDALKQEYENLSLLEYSLENKQAYTAFIEGLKRALNELKEFENNKNEVYSQLSIRMNSVVKNLIKEFKRAKNVIAEDDRNKMQEDRNRLKEIAKLKISQNTLEEINTASLFVDEFLREHTLTLVKVKKTQLKRIKIKIGILKKHITTYYELIDAIEEKFEMKIYENEYEDLFGYKDYYKEIESLTTDADYATLNDGISGLDEAIKEIQVGMEHWKQELEKEVEDSSGWVMNPITYIGEGVSENKILKRGEGEEHLDKLSKGELNDRHGGINFPLNKPMHEHLDDGDRGMSFYYRKEENGSVTPVVYDYANKRLGNKYKWTHGKISSGPSNSK